MTPDYLNPCNPRIFSALSGQTAFNSDIKSPESSLEIIQNDAHSHKLRLRKSEASKTQFEQQQRNEKCYFKQPLNVTPSLQVRASNQSGLDSQFRRVQKADIYPSHSRLQDAKCQVM
ncbi:hypothetical protein TNCV_2485251 [Trichonephila clavipes]|uniref:Uncharacterized protein n=1 Tax=Trichonephila clavipes TaxID=2585209 RepID=A0A8X6VZN2_TRICX|nr:hypothetical protein TNCV_2485251 [Trichonephila clavipes]